MNEDIKWIPIMIEPKNLSITTIRQTMSENRKIMEYLKNNCRTPEGDKITNIDQISDELIYHFIGLKIDSLKNKATNNWDKTVKIYFKTRNIKQIVAKEKNSWMARKNDNFCNYIFELQQQNPRLAKILKNIIWKDSIELKDITKKVLKQIIRDSNWNLRKNLNKVHPNDHFIIVYPLTNGEPESVDISEWEKKDLILLVPFTTQETNNKNQNQPKSNNKSLIRNFKKITHQEKTTTQNPKKIIPQNPKERKKLISHQKRPPQQKTPLKKTHKATK